MLRIFFNQSKDVAFAGRDASARKATKENAPFRAWEDRQKGPGNEPSSVGHLCPLWSEAS